MPKAKSVTPYRFNRNDRIHLDGSTYIWLKKQNGRHLLQRLINDVPDDNFIAKTDLEFQEGFGRKSIRVEPQYFSRTMMQIRASNDNTEITNLNHAQLCGVLWRAEWCKRFDALRLEPKPEWRPTVQPDDLARFIELYKPVLDTWYAKVFKHRRGLGRKVDGDSNKEFDYPSPTTLREWLYKYWSGGERIQALKYNHHRCGNRDQLDPRIAEIIENEVRHFASSLRPTKRDIFMRIVSKLAGINATLPESQWMSVSERTVRLRIDKIDPLFRQANRYGKDKALRGLVGVGDGIIAELPLERVEVDDVDVDLMTLLCRTETWKSLSDADRAKLSRVRLTLTIAIDTVTKCILGLNMTVSAPSTFGAKTAMLRCLSDKTKMAQDAGAKFGWEMHGRPNGVVTDGGAAFLGDFRIALATAGINHSIPEQNPTKRGTIESNLRFLKPLIRKFAGQTWENVVKRGDYPAEEMASLTVDAFRDALIRWICDYYHNTPHRGLFGSTPRAMWERLIEKRGAPPPSDELTLKIAFGHKAERVLGPKGVAFHDIYYNSVALNSVFRDLENVKVDTFIDERDMSSVIVRVPDEGNRGSKGQGSYLTVPAVDSRFKGMSLTAYLKLHAAAIKVAKDDEAAVAVVRMMTNEEFNELGEQAREQAQLAAFTTTSAEMAAIEAALERETNAALDFRLDGVVAAPDEVPGLLVETGNVVGSSKVPGKSQRKGRGSRSKLPSPQIDDTPPQDSRPFGGHMNLDPEVE